MTASFTFISLLAHVRSIFRSDGLHDISDAGKSAICALFSLVYAFFPGWSCAPRLCIQRAKLLLLLNQLARVVSNSVHLENLSTTQSNVRTEHWTLRSLCSLSLRSQS